MSNLTPGSASVPPMGKLNVGYPPSSINLTYKDEECKTPEYEKRVEKVFSRSIAQSKIDEYKVGKYTKKYIEAYIDFVHLEGVIDNLEFLEFKNILKELEA